jgi:hypothetical protein
MESEMIAVLCMTAAFLGFGIWLQMKSRQEAIKLEQQTPADRAVGPEEKEIEREYGKQSATKGGP